MVAGVLIVGLSLLCTVVLFSLEGDSARNELGWKIFGCVIIGLLSGILIGHCTEYYTSYSKNPTVSITESGRYGPATVMIQVNFRILVPTRLVCHAACTHVFC